MSNTLLQDHAMAIRKLNKRTVADTIEIGQRLTECRDILKEDGKWRAWLETEFKWDEKTARNFINVHEWSKSKSGNFPHSDLPLSAIYLLAAPSTSDEAREEISKRVASGEKVKHKDVADVTRKSKRAKQSNGLRAEIEAAVKAAGARGMIVDELKVKFGDKHNEQTVNSTTNLLVKADVLRDSGEKRQGRAKGGRASIIYVWITESDRVPVKSKKQKAKTEAKSNVVKFADHKLDAEIARMIENGSLAEILTRWTKGKSRVVRIACCYQLVQAIIPSEDSLGQLNEYRMALKTEAGDVFSGKLGDVDMSKPKPLSAFQRELLQYRDELLKRRGNK